MKKQTKKLHLWCTQALKQICLCNKNRSSNKKLSVRVTVEGYVGFFTEFCCVNKHCVDDECMEKHWTVGSGGAGGWGGQLYTWIWYRINNLAKTSRQIQAIWKVLKWAKLSLGLKKNGKTMFQTNCSWRTICYIRVCLHKTLDLNRWNIKNMLPCGLIMSKLNKKLKTSNYNKHLAFFCRQ